MFRESDARALILARVAGEKPERTPARAAMEYALLPREYRRAGVLSLEERQRLFEDRLRDYDAGVHRATLPSVSATIGQLLAARGARRVAVPGDFPAALLPPGFDFLPGDGLSAQDLDGLDGAVSGCAAAIAISGSLVLQSAAWQGPRMLSLVPDYLLCLVRAEQIVETVPEAFGLLAATSSLPTTFISGPSATADIEMTRIRGVHGPRVLDVVLVSGEDRI
jgi:L-lactate dehydrogenase complex protein LldG